MKKWLVTALKAAIAAVALYFAFRNIKWEELKAIHWGLSVLWFFPAILLYNISQFISAYRLLQFYNLLDNAYLIVSTCSYTISGCLLTFFCRVGSVAIFIM